ncbi:MAG: hypothetical protein RJB38_117 [Pseudomonadota bacterium]|jgi:methyl-accepting chemotaxis protein
MNLKFKTRVSLTIAVACVICTGAAILIARSQIAKNGEAALVQKSEAILSRLEVGRDYVADMGLVDEIVAETVKKFPSGNVSDEQRLKILKTVPVYAAFKLGGVGAEKENYRFRVASDSPRNRENQATPEEAELIEKFRADSKLAEVTSHTADGKFLRVTRPVRISEKQGCLSCHGHPSTSPWGNGKDVLGFRMENMKDGDLRGTFTVISSLQPVQEATKAATTKIALLGAIFAGVALFIGYLLTRRPIGRLGDVAQSLAGAGSELGTASGQISSVSQALSSGSTQSAASLEETVASIEQLSSMVARNADNAKEASSLSADCRSSAERGEAEIRELIQAIAEIAHGSKKIEEIIKVIDDIAFQTNLLALNAAVEAARAGEQGRGFAVVAEAVRNLAQRSASAAKDITGLIQDSVEKVQRGSSLAAHSGTALNEIVTAVKKVADINSEIASASAEQSAGISQISKAMLQLDQATQQNAAASEEAAASAEEMAAQARALLKLVEDLSGVIDGTQTDHSGLSNDWDSNSSAKKPAQRGSSKRLSRADAVASRVASRAGASDEVFPESALLEEGASERKISSAKDISRDF